MCSSISVVNCLVFTKKKKQYIVPALQAICQYPSNPPPSTPPAHLPMCPSQQWDWYQTLRFCCLPCFIYKHMCKVADTQPQPMEGTCGDHMMSRSSKAIWYHIVRYEDEDVTRCAMGITCLSHDDADGTCWHTCADDYGTQGRHINTVGSRVQSTWQQNIVITQNQCAWELALSIRIDSVLEQMPGSVIFQPILHTCTEEANDRCCKWNWVRTAHLRIYDLQHALLLTSCSAQACTCY